MKDELTEREDAKHTEDCERWQWEPEDRHGTCDCGADEARGRDHYQGDRP